MASGAGPKEKVRECPLLPLLQIYIIPVALQAQRRRSLVAAGAFEAKSVAIDAESSGRAHLIAAGIR